MDALPLYQYKVRVYAEDVDFMGIVYHVNYLCYFERARTELLRENNLVLTELVKLDLLFAVNKLHIHYRSPARLDDLLIITTQVEKSGACSLLFRQEMQDQQGEKISEAKVQVVCVNSKLRPKRFPYKKLFS